MRKISEIATEIQANWKNINPHVKPYLDAMKTLNSVSDNYYNDSGESVILYFLSNATYWRGETAKRIKEELKLMI